MFGFLVKNLNCFLLYLKAYTLPWWNLDIQALRLLDTFKVWFLTSLPLIFIQDNELTKNITKLID